MIDIFGRRFNYWQYLANFWSIVFFVVIVYDFIYNNAVEGALEIIAFIYVGTLAIYVGNKEFERWYSRHSEQHPGELFVLAWTMLIFVLLALTLIFNKDYHMPSAVISSYIAVLTILAITEKSKSLHRRRK